MREIIIEISDYSPKDYKYIYNGVDTIIEVAMLNGISFKDFLVPANGQPFFVHMVLPEDTKSIYNQNEILSQLPKLKNYVEDEVSAYKDRLFFKSRQKFVMFIIKTILCRYVASYAVVHYVDKGKRYVIANPDVDKYAAKAIRNFSK